MASETILIADDDHAIRTVLNQALSRAGYEVRATSNAATLWKWVSAGEGDLVITDVLMPDENGLDLLPRMKKLRPDLQVIVMSAQNTMMTAVNATQRGAFEYLPKPFDLTEVLNIVRRALSTHTEQPHTPPNDGNDQLPLIGRSAAMQEVYRTLARLMNTDLTVLINGESGTGKELAARALHDYGKRKNHPFIAINMAAIPRELIESELFGHEKGAFTGAVSKSSGKFEQAEGGTLFLDEIGDMPPEAQTRLLRVLQEGEYTSVGGRTAVKTNVRVIAATHRDLTQLIRQGLFREDLYYRLNVVRVRVPPLRERASDIPLLAATLVERASKRLARQISSVSEEALALLTAHSWPGNVRELENVLERAVIVVPPTGQCIEAEHLTFDGRSVSMPAMDVSATLSENTQGPIVSFGLDDGHSSLSIKLHAAELERHLIVLALRRTEGHRGRAAALLEISSKALAYKIRDYGIQP